MPRLSEAQAEDNRTWMGAQATYGFLFLFHSIIHQYFHHHHINKQMENKLRREIYLMPNPINPTNRSLQPKVPNKARSPPHRQTKAQQPEIVNDRAECEEKQMDRLVTDLEQCEEKIMERKKLVIGSAKGGFVQRNYDKEIEKCRANTAMKIDSQTQISQKTLILAIVKELHYLYKKLPEASQESSKELESIFRSNEKIFLQVVKNKINLNNLLSS